MHDLNSEIWLDARADFCWMRARARASCRQPARLLISRARWLPARHAARQPAASARWLLNARTVAKTDVRIVFLIEFWV